MGEWKEYKLGDFVESISETYKFKHDEEVVFLNTSDIYLGRVINHQVANSSTLPGQAKKRIKRGDFLFSEIRPANGRYALIDFDADKYVVSTKLMVLRCNEKIDRDFFRIFLTSKDQLDYLQMIAEDRSGTFPQITFDHIYSLDITLPPLPEQKSIASILISLDDKIDLLHRQNKTLEALAETLFKQWFVEEAKDGWETGKLGDYASVSTGKGLKRNEFFEDGKYPVLGANGEIGRTNNYLTDDRLILTGRVGTLGKVYISEDKVWISDNVLIVRPESIFFYPVYFILKRTEFENLNVGSTQPLVTQTDLKNIEFKLPSADILESYEKQCLTYFKKISKNKVQIRTLTRLRDTLLPKLMSGEVRVKDH